jgi:beta-glucosidase
VTPGGTTLLAAIRKAVSGKTDVTFSKDGTGAAGATVGVVVIGEQPYAEFEGDRADLKLSQEDIDAVSTMKAAGIPVVVVIFSGRPLILGDVLNKADAVVAAWLPGTEGAGVTDVLFGDFKPSGKLSFTWPRVVGDKANPQFRFGYGLSY